MKNQHFLVPRMIAIAILFFLSTSFTLGQYTAVEDISKKDVDQSINKDALQHPYLYFSESDKSAIKERIQNNPDLQLIMDRLKAVAKKLIHQPIERTIPIQGRHTRADWTKYDRNGEYEDYYFTNRNNAFKLAFIYQMTGKEKYARKAFKFADAFCDLPSWTMRAHEFPIIYTRIWPWNVPNDQVNFNFDHYNGDSGRMMAAVYDWLYPALNKKQRDRIRGALIEKVITRVRGNYEYHWWATSYRCNWCGVCNSGIGLAGLALLKEDPQLTDVVAESYNRINKMFSELGKDGGWQEGGAYWNYGVHTSTFFADAMKRATEGKYNLFENHRLNDDPVTFPLYISVPGGSSLNFEDSRGGTIGSVHLINKLAKETNSKIAAWYREEFFGRGKDLFNIIWPKPDIKAAPPENASIHFRTLGWWVMRSDFKDPSKVLVAGKAGKNNDPHHGHLDVGHFVVQWKNQYFIRDIGSGSYDEKYFNDARWDYPQASSVGHNVVFVNGEKQLPGKTKGSEMNNDIGGKILEFRGSENQDYVIMDNTNAYPQKEMEGWRRHIMLEKPKITILLDEVKADQGDEIEARFHSDVETELKKKYAILKGKGGKIALIPVVNEDFHFRTGKHACQPVNATRDFFWIPYFGTVLEAEEENTVMATLILPIKSEREASHIASSALTRIDSSGNMELAFNKGGKTYSYKFIKTDKGLVME